MTSRRNLLCFLAFTCLLISTSTVCRGQGRATETLNATTPTVNQADVEAAVALLCKPADMIRSKNGNASGCKACPEGTDFFGQNMGEWELRNTLVGHFTSAEDNELIVSGFNCDSHANNFGGSFIFSLNTGKPRLLRYNSGLITDTCHKFRYADGREFLVCRGGWSGQGENDASVFLTRFDAAAKNVDDMIFRTFDATATCGDDSTVKIPSSGIKNIEFSSKDSGELTGMTITATFGQVTCGEVNAKRAPGKEIPSVKTYELNYIFDGRQFGITPESKAALKVFPQRITVEL
jgi:hypothetical protein